MAQQNKWSERFWSVVTIVAAVGGGGACVKVYVGDKSEPSPAATPFVFPPTPPDLEVPRAGVPAAPAENRVRVARPLVESSPFTPDPRPIPCVGSSACFP